MNEIPENFLNTVSFVKIRHLTWKGRVFKLTNKYPDFNLKEFPEALPRG